MKEKTDTIQPSINSQIFALYKDIDVLKSTTQFKDKHSKNRVKSTIDNLQKQVFKLENLCL